MATLVCSRAQPDDDSIATGGLMAAAAAGGDRVVLVVATRGEHGEVAVGRGAERPVAAFAPWLDGLS